LYKYSPAEEVRDNSYQTVTNTSDIVKLTHVQNPGFVDIPAGEKLENFMVLLLLFITIAEVNRHSLS
jgi:hypothetical protein